jgi:hypothetical protein
MLGATLSAGGFPAEAGHGGDRHFIFVSSVSYWNTSSPDGIASWDAIMTCGWHPYYTGCSPTSGTAVDLSTPSATNGTPVHWRSLGFGPYSLGVWVRVYAPLATTCTGVKAAAVENQTGIQAGSIIYYHTEMIGAEGWSFTAGADPVWGTWTDLQTAKLKQEDPATCGWTGYNVHQFSESQFDYLNPRWPTGATSLTIDDVYDIFGRNNWINQFRW